MSLETTAIHEAGHAVAHRRLGIDQGGLSVEPDREAQTLGRSFSAGAGHCWNVAEAGDMALAYCAGYGAVRAAGYTEAEAKHGCADDFSQAKELVRFWGLESLVKIKAKAVELMRQPANVNAVKRVADELVARRTIDADLLAVLFDVADGDCSAEEFERYLLIRAAR